MVGTITDSQIEGILNAPAEKQFEILNDLSSLKLNYEDKEMVDLLQEKIFPGGSKSSPELITELKKEGKGFWKHIGAGFIAATNEEKARAAAINSDKYFMPTYKNGGWGVYRKNPKDPRLNEFVYVNRPGRSAQDLATILTELAAFIPAARIPSFGYKIGNAIVRRGRLTARDQRTRDLSYEAVRALNRVGAPKKIKTTGKQNYRKEFHISARKLKGKEDDLLGGSKYKEIVDAKVPGVIGTVRRSIGGIFPAAQLIKAVPSVGAGTLVLDIGRQHASKDKGYRDDYDIYRPLTQAAGAMVGAGVGSYIPRFIGTVPLGSKAIRQTSNDYRYPVSEIIEEAKEYGFKIPKARAEVYARAKLSAEQVANLEANMSIGGKFNPLQYAKRSASNLRPLVLPTMNRSPDVNPAQTGLIRFLANTLNEAGRLPRQLNKLDLNEAGYDMLTGRSFGKLVRLPSIQEGFAGAGVGLTKYLTQ